MRFLRTHSTVLFLFCCARVLWSQSPTAPEPTLSGSAASDTNGVRSQFVNTGTVGDTVASAPALQRGQVGLAEPVSYSARVFDSRDNGRVLYLLGDAEVKYKNFVIKAGKITVRWEDHLMIAEMLPDSLLASNGDTLRFKDRGRPFFSDGNEDMYGDKMEFNFKTERGRVLRGRTDFQSAYYQGEVVKRVEPKVFFVRNGLYTTCDKEEPHFHFQGKKMKVILGDKVVAKPVVFVIGKVPVFVLPFAMFEIKEDGRQSGLIIPNFGRTEREGRYFQNLGFYWATNDYMDMRFTLDFFEKTGVVLRTAVNYALRYRFSGAFSGSYTRKTFGESQQQERWDLSIRHNQTFNPRTTLAVNATFVSDNNVFKDLSTDRDQRLNRQLISNFTFTTSSASRKNSLTVNLSQTRDLQTGRESLTLPQIRFTRNRSSLFAFQEDPRGRRTRKWYHNIQYDYKGFLSNTAQRDSSGAERELQTRVNHDFSLTFTSPGKLFGAVSLTQRLVYDEDWFDRTNRFKQDSSGTIVPVEKKGFAIRRLFSYTANASTNLFGTFFPNLGPIKALRHKMSPSLSFTYQPDYTSDFWGYFETVEDSAGNPVLGPDGKPIKRDRFGGTPRIEQNRLGFSLNNLFQMKWGQGENQKKIDLFNLNFSTGYNFAADSLKLENLRTAFFANPRRNLNITMGLTHSFYRFDPTLNRTVNDLRAPRLTQFNIDLRWSIGGKRAVGPTSGSQRVAEASEREEEVEQEKLASGDREQRYGSEWSLTNVPWRATIALTYSLNKFNPNNPSRTWYLNLSNVQVQLTKNWRIGYRLRWDIERGELAEHSISFYRDLHCWEAQFNWNPTGITKGFYFRIGIKAAQLRDIKFEQRGGTSTIFRGF